MKTVDFTIEFKNGKFGQGNIFVPDNFSKTILEKSDLFKYHIMWHNTDLNFSLHDVLNIRVKP